jgi:hypothetical protein
LFAKKSQSLIIFTFSTPPPSSPKAHSFPPPQSHLHQLTGHPRLHSHIPRSRSAPPCRAVPNRRGPGPPPLFPNLKSSAMSQPWWSSAFEQKGKPEASSTGIAVKQSLAWISFNSLNPRLRLSSSAVDSAAAKPE